MLKAKKIEFERMRKRLYEAELELEIIKKPPRISQGKASIEIRLD